MCLYSCKLLWWNHCLLYSVLWLRLKQAEQTLTVLQAIWHWKLHTVPVVYIGMMWFVKWLIVAISSNCESFFRVDLPYNPIVILIMTCSASKWYQLTLKFAWTFCTGEVAPYIRNANLFNFRNPKKVRRLWLSVPKKRGGDPVELNQ